MDERATERVWDIICEETLGQDLAEAKEDVEELIEELELRISEWR